MPTKTLLEKYATLAAETGANVQKGQDVVIRSSTETRELARAITNAAYKAGARRVSVQWSDDYVSRYGLEHMNTETLEEVPEWIVEQTKHFINSGACFISITSPVPGLNAGIDPVKMQRAAMSRMKKLKFAQDHMMGNKTQWTIVAAPNAEWAQKVFPNTPKEEAIEKLWQAIFKACRVTEDNNPVNDWAEHNARLASHNAVLNQHQFDSLHFSNSIGTDITIKLVDNHVWAGGNEHTTSSVEFNPNIPTEESFTMPHRDGTSGKVVATKPLNYQGNLIEDFWLEFKDGMVVDYDAKKEKDTLKNLIELDEGSSRLGEIALISHNSPISNSDILFLNTLFDENASCHMALGRAYPMNVENGVNMSQDALEAIGYNQSMAHSDFMFGSADLKVVGTKKDGTKIVVFENGDFVI